MVMEVIEEGFDTNVFEIAIYRNVDLDNNNGVDPEYTLVNHLSPSLSDIGINHRIRWDFDPVPIFNNDMGCGSGTAKEEWTDYFHNSGEVPWQAADSNIMMSNSNGGGCGDVGGPVCVGPGGRLDRRYERVFGGPEGWIWTVRACMHEIGHNMGFSHMPNPAMKWNDENGQLHTTPTSGDMFNTENMCGESVAARLDNGEPRVPEVWYNDCVADHITIHGPPVGFVRITDVTVSPNPVHLGQTVAIEATMSNTTNDHANVTEPVLVGDDQVGSFSFSVAPGDQQTRSMSYTTQSIGEHIVQVNQGVDHLVVEEVPPGEISIADISTNPSPPVVESETDVVITAENVGEQAIEETVDVLVDGEVVDFVTFDLDAPSPNRTPAQTRTASWTPQSDGMHTISAKGMSVDVDVDSKPTIPEPDLGISGTEAAVIGAGALLALRYLLGGD